MSGGLEKGDRVDRKSASAACRFLKWDSRRQGKPGTEWVDGCQLNQSANAGRTVSAKAATEGEKADEFPRRMVGSKLVPPGEVALFAVRPTTKAIYAVHCIVHLYTSPRSISQFCYRYGKFLPSCCSCLHQPAYDFDFNSAGEACSTVSLNLGTLSHIAIPRLQVHLQHRTESQSP